MAIVGSAYVEIHTITTSVPNEIREALRRGMAGAGRDAGNTFGDEFDDAASARASNAGDNASDEFGERIRRGMRGAADSAAGEFGSRFEDAVSRRTREASRRASEQFRDEFGRFARRSADDLGNEFGDRFGDAAASSARRRGGHAAEQFRDEFGRFARRGARDSGNDFGDGFINALSARLRNIKPIKLPIFSLAFADVIGSGIAPLLGILTQVGAAAFAMAGQITHAVAALGALAGAIGQASQSAVAIPVLYSAIAQAFVVTRLASSGLNDAISAVATGADDAAEKLAKLPPAAREFAIEAAALRPLLLELRATAAAGLFPGVSDGVQSLVKLFPVFNRAVGVTSESVGGLARSFGAMLAGPLAGPLEAVLLGNAVVIERFGSAFLNIIGILVRVIAAAQPMVQLMGSDLVAATGRWLDSVTRLQESGDLSETFLRSYNTLKLLLSVLGNVGGALRATFGAGTETGIEMLQALDLVTSRWETWAKSFAGQNVIRDYFASAWQSLQLLGSVLANVIVTFANMAEAARPAGTALMTSLEGVTQRWREFTGSVEGQNRLREFFDASVPVMQEFGRLLAGIGMALVHFAQLPGNEALVNQIRTQLLPAVERLFTALAQTGLFTMFITFLTDMTNTLTSLAGSTGAAVGIMHVFSAALGVINTLLAIPGLSQLLLLATYLAGASAAMSLIIAVAKGLTSGLWILSAAWSGLTLVMTAAGRQAILLNAQVALMLVKHYAVAAATAVWTGAQWLLNAALTANPIGIVVVAIAALVAGLVLAYQNSETFRNFVTTAFNAVLDIGRRVGEWFAGPFVDFFVGAFEWIRGVLDSVIGFFQSWGAAISDAFAAFLNIPNVIRENWGTVTQFFTDVWNNVVSAVQTGVGNVVSFVQDLPNNIAYALGNFAGTLLRLIVGAWLGVTTFFTQAFIDLVAFFTQLPGRIVTALVNFGAMLAENAKNAGTSFVNSIITISASIVTFFTDLPGRIGNALVSLGTTLVTIGVNAWNGFTGAIQTAWEVTAAFVSSIPGRIVSFLVTLVTTLQSQGSVAWSGFTEGIISAWVSTVAFLVSIPGRITAFFTGAAQWLLQIGVDIVSGLVNGVTNAWNSVLGFVQGLIDSFIQGFKDGLGIASPSTIFADIGRWIIEGLLNGLRAVGQLVIDFIVGLGNMLVAGFTASIDFLSSLWTNFWSFLNSVSGNAFDGIRVMIETVWDIIKVLFSAAIDLLTGNWDGFWQKIQTVATVIWNAVQTYLQTGLNAFSTFFTTIWNSVSSFFSVTWTGIQNFAITIWNAISTFFTNAFNFYVNLFTSTWTNVRDFFSATWTGIQNIAVTLWNAISSFFVAGFNFYVNLFTDIWTNVRNFFDTVWKAIQTIATTLWNAIAAFYTSSFNNYTTFFTNVWTNIRNFFTSIWDAIRNIASTSWNAISTFFTNALNTFRSSWDTFWGNISSGFQGIWSGIRSIAETAWRGINDMFRGGINLVIDAVNWPINKINEAIGISIPTIPRLATGGTTDEEGRRRAGRVKGAGSTTSDAVLTRLSREEHVWSAAEVRAAGGHDAVRRMRAQVMAGYAPDSQPGNLANTMTAQRVDPNALGRSVAEGVRRRQLMDKFPKLDDAGIGMLAYGGVQPHVALAGQEIERIFGRMPGGIGGVGQRSNASDHPSGHALDFMTLSNVGLGDRIAQHLIGNAQRLAVKYLIWQQAINSGGGWERMEDRGSVTANHFDHVHASFLRAGEVGKAFSGGGLFDPGAIFDAAAAALGLPESGRNIVRGIMPDSPPWLEPMGISFYDKAWNGMRAASIRLLEQVSTLGGLLGGDASGNAAGPVADQVRTVARQYGWDTGGEWAALDRLVQKESSWNPAAANPTSSARGLFQKMTSIHGPVEPTAAGQAQWGLGYIEDRYGSPSAALAHHNRVGWYDTGGWLPPGLSTAINGTGKPEAIIADPMTTFERSFKAIFKWLAPDLRDALMKGIARLDDVVADNGGKAPNWLGKILDRFRTGGDGATPTAGTGPNTASIIVPEPVVPAIEMPPVVVPQLPVGDFGSVFQDVLSQFAPELSLALKAGSTGQIEQFAKELAANPERVSAISAAMTDALGSPVTNLNTVLSDLIASVAKPTVVIPPVAMPPATPTPTQDTRWLESQFARFRDVISGQLNESSNAGELLKRFPDLAADFYKMFPDVKRATETSAIDVNKTLASRADDILAYLATKSQEDASNLIGALSGRSSTFTGAYKDSATDLILSNAQASVAPSYAQNSGPAQMTISEGAFQVTISGNADSVTVAELQETLQAWGEEILHEYEGRT